MTDPPPARTAATVAPGPTSEPPSPRPTGGLAPGTRTEEEVRGRKCDRLHDPGRMAVVAFMMSGAATSHCGTGFESSTESRTKGNAQLPIRSACSAPMQARFPTVSRAATSFVRGAKGLSAFPVCKPLNQRLRLVPETARSDSNARPSRRFIAPARTRRRKGGVPQMRQQPNCLGERVDAKGAIAFDDGEGYLRVLWFHRPIRAPSVECDKETTSGRYGRRWPRRRGRAWRADTRFPSRAYLVTKETTSLARSDFHRKARL